MQTFNQELIGKKLLIFDLETTSVDINTCEIISFHYYSYYFNSYGNLMFKDNEQKIQNLLDFHNIFVTFNGDEFDIKIVSRIYQKKYNYTKPIDLMKICKKRGGLMLYGGFKNNSLEVIAETLKLSSLKDTTFNYSLLQKKEFTSEEIEYIFKYGEQDIKVTKELFEYCYDYFYFWKEYLDIKDIISWSWLMSSPGTYSYKVICHLSGIPEEWNDNIDTQNESFKGGFISEPLKEFEEGNIYCLDFSSAYPHALVMINLFSYDCICCSDTEKYKGGNLFTMNNSYCSKKLNPVSEVIKKLYLQRLKYKKNKDIRQFPLKIILNTIYGICSNPVFKSVYNLNSAKDCTYFCRESIKLARDKFTKAGYIVLYSDTDSVYLKDVYNDIERLKLVKSSIINQIKCSVPFPLDTFDLEIEEPIKYIYFPNKMKKNYLYVTVSDNIKIKGMPIIKSDASKLGLIIFNKYIKDNIKHGMIKIDYRKIRNYASEELHKDLTLSARYFKVLNCSEYKDSSSLQYKISDRYGEGRHLLVPNKRYGIGNSIKYCSIEEFKKYNLDFDDLVLSKFWSEMEPFITEKKEYYNQNSLLAWTNSIRTNIQHGVNNGNKE